MSLEVCTLSFDALSLPDCGAGSIREAAALRIEEDWRHRYQGVALPVKIARTTFGFLIEDVATFSDATLVSLVFEHCLDCMCFYFVFREGSALLRVLLVSGLAAHYHVQ